MTQQTNLNFNQTYAEIIQDQAEKIERWGIEDDYYESLEEVFDKCY